MSPAQVKLSFIGGGVEVYDREWITLEFCGQGDRLTLRCPECGGRCLGAASRLT